MLIDPSDLGDDPDRIEEVERLSLRLVFQAISDFRVTAQEIFRRETDLPQDIAEDVTREALDRMGVPRIDERLFGKVDYKRACYVFHPEYAIRQALFVDSKAEKTTDNWRTVTIQTAQTSLRVRQFRANQIFDEQGTIPCVWETPRGTHLTTTIFVKYIYDPRQQDRLRLTKVVALPNGMLQEQYNPNHEETIWQAGRNAPTRGEPFRVRIDLRKLQSKALWRVQEIPPPPAPLIWRDTRDTPPLLPRAT